MGKPQDRDLQGDKREAQHHRQNAGPRQPGAHLIRIPRAERLRRQARGPHAQEVQRGVKNVHDHGGDGHGAHVFGPRQAADHRRIDQPQQRDGDVGRHDRQRQRPDAPVEGARVDRGGSGRRFCHRRRRGAEAEGGAPEAAPILIRRRPGPDRPAGWSPGGAGTDA